MDLTSKKTNILRPDQAVFNMLINCNNIAKYIPHDKVQDFQSTQTSCSFTVTGAGKIEMSLQEQLPFSRISYLLGNSVTKELSVLFHIEKKDEHTCELHIATHIELPFFMVQMVKSSLQKFIDLLVDHIKAAAENSNL
ncbi:MAG: hypothetical protein LBH82_03880 [Bacteroidales bacterium]|jgi:carbon monoxide dehydrogenase subunit G|nr:hypothetical protein [Bacteroidales bacterium]